MDVYLVPASPTRYALYCEVVARPHADGEPASASFWGRMVARFRSAVDEGEAEDRGEGDNPGRGRVRRFITRKLAEAVAEQRLLWHLRHESAARLLHPDTLQGADAVAQARAEFDRDYGRHRRWLVIDGLITLVTGPLLFFVPGPNVISWYFSFRAVGHFFSMRGARKALSVIEWTPVPSPPLTDVAKALALDPDRRQARVQEAAAALGLERLPSFVARVADRTA